MSSLHIFTDGGSRGNPGQAAIGVVVLDSENNEVLTYKEAIGIETNNVAEYRALLKATELLSELESISTAEMCRFFLDSKLVVEQVNGNWKVKEAHLQELVQKVRKNLTSLPCSYSIAYVPRAQNAQADKLVNEALDEL